PRAHAQTRSPRGCCDPRAQPLRVEQTLVRRRHPGEGPAAPGRDCRTRWPRRGRALAHPLLGPRRGGRELMRALSAANAANRDRYKRDPEYRARIARNNANWRRRNREAARAIVQRQRNKKRAWLMEQKRGKMCEFCGESDPCCLDWHHMDPTTKKFTVSHMWSH